MAVGSNALRPAVRQIDYNYTEAHFNETYVGNVTHGRGHIFHYVATKERWSGLMNAGARVFTSVVAKNTGYPVIFIVKQQRTVVSWEVPAVMSRSYVYYTVEQTPCPDQLCWLEEAGCEYVVEVSTASENETAFSLKTIVQTNFTISLNTTYQDWVHVSGPKYYLFNFPDDHEKVLLTVMSEDITCMEVTVTTSECPLQPSVSGSEEEDNPYQTMTKTAAITISRPRTGQVYIVFTISPLKLGCTQMTSILPAQGQQAKNFWFDLEPLAPDTQYIPAIMTGVAWCIAFYLGTAITVLVLHVGKLKSPGRPRQSRELEETDALTAAQPVPAAYGALGDQSSPARPSPATADAAQHQDEMMTPDVPPLPNDADVDLLEDIDRHKDVFRAKIKLMVADLARKEHKYLEKKYGMYGWSVVTTSIFYVLPVIQLVLTYKQVMNVTGNEDVCYYNFLCARRLGVLYNFNNVFSNIGYVLLGLLFMGITFRRQRQFKALEKSDPEFVKLYGIPAHFGLYYAVGWALMIEGVLSACYHVCPSYLNFQFDASFMYIIGGLLMLRLFQSRHPDINAKAHQAFLVLGALIGLEVIGVVYNTPAFWVVFTVLHLICVLLLSLQIYYTGRFRIDRLWLRSMAAEFSIIFCQRRCWKPAYPDRFALLVVMNLLNWGLSLYGVAKQPVDFASFVLAIIILNLMGYTLFYIIMKLIHKERICGAAIAHLVLSTCCWVPALYFFTEHASSWQLSPAESRAQNKPCLLLDFYDHHDVWHFLSAGALFLSFLGVFHIDDDLKYVERRSIPVF